MALSVADAIPSDLSYFDPQIIQTCILSEYDQEYGPIATLRAGTPIEFFIPGADGIYLDLSNSKLEIKLRVTLADGANIGGNHHV